MNTHTLQINYINIRQPDENNQPEALAIMNFHKVYNSTYKKRNALCISTMPLYKFVGERNLLKFLVFEVRWN